MNEVTILEALNQIYNSMQSLEIMQDDTEDEDLKQQLHDWYDNLLDITTEIETWFDMI